MLGQNQILGQKTMVEWGCIGATEGTGKLQQDFFYNNLFISATAWDPRLWLRAQHILDLWLKAQWKLGLELGERQWLDLQV